MDSFDGKATTVYSGTMRDRTVRGSTEDVSLHQCNRPIPSAGIRGGGSSLGLSDVLPGSQAAETTPVRYSIGTRRGDPRSEPRLHEEGRPS